MNKSIKAKPDELRTHRVSCSRRLTMNIIYSHCTSVSSFVKSFAPALYYPPSHHYL